MYPQTEYMVQWSRKNWVLKLTFLLPKPFFPTLYKYVVHFFADDYDIDEIREAISAVGEIDCGFEFSYLPRIRRIRNNEYSFIVDIH